MKKLLILLVFLTSLVSNEIINGETQVLKIDKNSVGKLYVNGKKELWITNPINEDEKIALVSANYRAKNDIVVKHFINGNEQVIEFKLIKGKYKQETLKVSNSKVSPPKEVLKRIKKERDEAYAIYALRSDEFLFDSKFIYPMDSQITSDYGNARVFNGSLKSYHSGTDFRAAEGTKIKASNDGVVKIAKDRYYAGGSVVIDHGGGVYSQYYHMSKIYVKVGQSVKRGEILGLSGSTGRVTGPHLHFGMVVNGNNVNPLKFIDVINYALFG
ncbi:zinc metallopeptidase, M23 family [Campylobacter blaseri]|uniref:Peptidase M24 n=1 Tax=Campylobacter blaseri TaxID=2042961 RepID=A0A2P8R298_9BACT|nr:M23 family metallopeptidase [Campylobacter blaseri]PSM52617.1 peptidase M24 [Campylobacter blaseri]PSM54265.1 peptidase M24 [Campylobacter blaseri]QKF85916.1 zinc metallopeptidase, M23 family [Campylobacter blaseri]